MHTGAAQHPQERQHTRFTHDLAISAVSYDTLLVTEMQTLLASRLESRPVWAADARPSVDGFDEAPLCEDESRVALVLLQHLWGADAVTAAEAAVLRLRVRRMPRSVVVVTLDEAALPGWMARLRHRSLGTLGLDAVADFVLEAIADAGGTVLAKEATLDGAPSSIVRWPEPPPPFLAQPRAHSALRRELEVLADTLQTSVDARKRDCGERPWELHKLPHRLVARLDDVGVTFSWLPGRDGSVRAGRLMVIEWIGVAPGSGVDALRAARPARERVYRVDADGPDGWSWRIDRPNGRASSSLNLANEWVAVAALGTSALDAGCTP